MGQARTLTLQAVDARRSTGGPSSRMAQVSAAKRRLCWMQRRLRRKNGTLAARRPYLELRSACYSLTRRNLLHKLWVIFFHFYDSLGCAAGAEGSRSKASRAGARELTLSNVSARSAAGVSCLLGVDADEDVGDPRGSTMEIQGLSQRRVVSSMWAVTRRRASARSAPPDMRRS